MKFNVNEALSAAGSGKFNVDDALKSASAKKQPVGVLGTLKKIDQDIPDAGTALMNLIPDTVKLGWQGIKQVPGLVNDAKELADYVLPINAASRAGAQDLENRMGNVVNKGASLLKGAAGKAGLMNASPQDTQIADAAYSWLKKNLTGPNIKNYIEQHPAHALLNLGLALDGAGNIIKVGGAADKGANLADFGEALAKAPFKVTAEAAKLPLKAIPDSLIERTYASGVKLPLSRKWTKVAGEDQVSARTRAIRKGLEAEALPNETGVEIANKGMQDAGNAIEGIVDSLTKQGQSAKTSDVIKGLKGAYERMMASGDPDSMAGAQKLEEMGNFIKQKYGDTMTAQELQDFKKQSYHEINYDKPTANGVIAQAKELGKKGMANAAMNLLEEMNPEIKTANRNWADYKLLKEALERASGRIQNHDLISLGDEVAGAAGAAAAGGPGGAMTALARHIIMRPAIRARLAILLNKLKNAGSVASDIADVADEVPSPETAQLEGSGHPALPPGTNFILKGSPVDFTMREAPAPGTGEPVKITAHLRPQLNYVSKTITQIVNSGLPVNEQDQTILALAQRYPEAFKALHGTKQLAYGGPKFMSPEETAWLRAQALLRRFEAAKNKTKFIEGIR